MTSEPAEGPSPKPPPPPTIHEAERASGASGAILYGPEIDFDVAVARRRTGEDVVVRGDDVKANRRLMFFRPATTTWFDNAGKR